MSILNTLSVLDIWESGYRRIRAKGSFVLFTKMSKSYRERFKIFYVIYSDSGGPVRSVQGGYLAGIISWSEGEIIEISKLIRDVILQLYLIIT